MEKLNNEFNTENLLRDIFLRYVNKIDELQSSNNIEELQKILNHVINLLPSDVTSFSVPIVDREQHTVVTSERDSTLPKEKQKEWGMSDLIEFSMSIDSDEDYNPVD
jgi:hypothetical protein